MQIRKHYNFFPLMESWKKLYEDNITLSPYQSEKYAAIAFLHYLPYAVRLHVMPVFLEIMERGSTIMIVPLCKNIFRKEYSLFGYRSGYGYLDFIYSKSMADIQMEECFRLIGQTLKGCNLRLARLRDDSRLSMYLLQRYACMETEICEHIDLPESYDLYFSSLSKSARQNIRTAYNRLMNKHKTISLKTYYKKTMPAEELFGLIELYAARRKSRYGQSNGYLIKLFLKHFDIGTVAMRQLDNYVHFILSIDDCPAAFLNAFVSPDDSNITIIRLAISDEFAEFSPGILLLNESIKKIFDLDITRKIDLLSGDEEYKREMGGEPHYSYGFNLFF